MQKTLVTGAIALVLLVVYFFLQSGIDNPVNPPPKPKPVQKQAAVFVGDCSHVDQLAAKLKEINVLIETRYDYAEWLVTPAWYTMTLTQKEELVRVASAARLKCKNFHYVKIMDGHSGKELAKMGALYPEIITE